MRIVLVLALSALLVVAAGGAALFVSQSGDARRTPVLVELFTSEGCSSCPAVDSYVAKLKNDQPFPNAEVVLLSFHVDYWDRLGWKDRFSSHDYTLRQQQYSSLFAQDQVYTPELIVDGKEGRPESLPQSIRDAASAQKPVSVRVTPKTASVVTIAANGDANSSTRVLVAIAEDGLTTRIGGGENGGKTLMHSGVVRKLATLGKLEKGTLTRDFAVSLDKKWQPSKLMLVCFAQDEKTGRVLGITAQPLAELMK